MSRTIRRKSGFGQNKLYDELKDWDNWDYWRMSDAPHLDPKSDEGKRRIARYHSDASRVCHNEPGPAWYRHTVVDVPWRREAKRQLRRYMKDTEFVVILNGKDPLPYWD